MDVKLETLEPWNLRRFPRYDDALTLETVDASAFSEAEFFAEFVEKNRPCHLKGAAKHWKAYREWGSLDYLRRKTTRYATVVANGKPNDDHTTGKRALKRLIRFHEFLDRAATKPPYLKGGWVLGAEERGGLGGLISDIGDYSFISSITGSTLPGMEYDATYRIFFYCRSYTDWHYHVGEEALMTQVTGTKEILLLPPTEHTWNVLKPIEAKKGYFYNVDVDEFPQYADLVPYKVVSEPGDALYIPVYWWHAVYAPESDFGVTFVVTFQSPPQVRDDMSYPAARERSLTFEEVAAKVDHRARTLEAEGF